MNGVVQNNLKSLIPRDALTPEQRDEMFSLLSSHFEGVTRVQFEHDLAEKNWVIEVREGSRLVGFSTLLFCEVNFEGCDLTVIYSGDTIMAPEAWGRPTLARTWIAAVNFLRSMFPSRLCYWLLLTSGFRTYRFLPIFWREFYPSPDSPTPVESQRLLNFLAGVRYGEAFDHSVGIVRFAHPQKLRVPLQKITEGRLSNPYVNFFLQRNPGHLQGDELACLTQIHESNLTRAGWRMLQA